MKRSEIIQKIDLWFRNNTGSKFSNKTIAEFLEMLENEGMLQLDCENEND